MKNSYVKCWWNWHQLDWNNVLYLKHWFVVDPSVDLVKHLCGVLTGSFHQLVESAWNRTKIEMLQFQIKFKLIIVVDHLKGRIRETKTKHYIASQRLFFLPMDPGWSGDSTNFLSRSIRFFVTFRCFYKAIIHAK